MYIHVSSREELFNGWGGGVMFRVGGGMPWMVENAANGCIQFIKLKGLFVGFP